MSFFGLKIRYIYVEVRARCLYLSLFINNLYVSFVNMQCVKE